MPGWVQFTELTRLFFFLICMQNALVTVYGFRVRSKVLCGKAGVMNVWGAEISFVRSGRQRRLKTRIGAERAQRV